jgi:hypothetical protein
MNFLWGSCKLLIFRTSHPHFAGLSNRRSRKDAKFAKGSTPTAPRSSRNHRRMASRQGIAASVTLCELCVFARHCFALSQTKFKALWIRDSWHAATFAGQLNRQKYPRTTRLPTRAAHQ